MPKDKAQMERLILSEGKHPYNWIPEKRIKKHLQEVADGKAGAVVAVTDGELIGFATYEWGNVKPRFSKEPHGYIAEVVVSAMFRGRGLGSRLVKRAMCELAKRGFSTVLIARHEGNTASARMMEKAGFKELCTFYDPKIRKVGSRKTTVCIFRLHEKS